MKRFADGARPNIEYPTRWKYTVIGVDRSRLESAVAEVVEERSYKLSLSNLSSKGRYVSLTLQLIVLNERERLNLFNSLRDHPAVSVVL